MSQHGSEPPTTATETAATDEVLRARNYDVETSHTVWIHVVDDGEQRLETTRRLRPGETRTVAEAIPPGEYDIEVGIDGLRREVGRCRVGPDPERTALVEVGNGVVSVTEGVR